MSCSSSTAFSAPCAPPLGLAACFLLIVELLCRLVVVDLALLFRRRRRLFLLLELLVVQLPVAGQRLRADHELRRDAAHVQVRFIVLALIEPLELEGHGRLLDAPDALELPRDLPVLPHVVRLRADLPQLPPVPGEERMEVQLLPRGREVVHVDRHRVLLVRERHGLLDPDDAHDLRDRRVEARHLLPDDGGALLGDERQHALHDVELLVGLRLALFLHEVRLQTAADLLEREVELRQDLRDRRDGLLRLVRVRHLGRAHVEEEDRRSVGEALPSALLEAVSPPVDVGGGLCEGASARLVEQGGAIRETENLHGLIGGQIAAKHDAHFDLERVALPHRRVPGQGGRVELRSQVPEDVLQALLDQPLPDRREAIRLRRHDLDLRDRVHDRLRLLQGERLRDAGRDARELFFEERAQLVRLRLLPHREERANLQPVRMGLDLHSLWGHLLRRTLPDDDFAFRRFEREARVRVHDRRALQVLRHGLLPADIATLQGNLDARPVRLVPYLELLALDGRLVLSRVDDEVKFVRHIHLRRLRADRGRLPRSDLTVHDGSGDPETLSASCLTTTVESGSVEQAPEHVRNLLLENPGPVVLDGNDELVLALSLPDLDRDIRKNLGLLAGVQGVVEEQDSPTAQELLAPGDTEIVDVRMGGLDFSDRLNSKE